MNLKELPERPKGLLFAMSITKTEPGGWSGTILEDEKGKRYLKKSRLRLGMKPCYEASFFQIRD